MANETLTAPTPARGIETDGLEGLRQTARRCRWVLNVRPLVLRGLVAKIFGPIDRRRLVTLDDGLKMFLDPLSILGRDVAETGTFEPETIEIFRSEVGPGDRVLDIGANEGFFSAMAGRLVGEAGFVASVEPQYRLRDLVEINMRANDVAAFRVFNAAVGGDEGAIGELNLYPAINSGATSLVRRARFMRTTQPTTFVSVETILRKCAVDRFDFVKVDTEGFEAEVVDALLPSIEAGRIGKLLVDYHQRILDDRGIDPKAIHRKVLDAGMTPRAGEPRGFSGYVLYDP